MELPGNHGKHQSLSLIVADRWFPGNPASFPPSMWSATAGGKMGAQFKASWPPGLAEEPRPSLRADLDPLDISIIAADSLNLQYDRSRQDRLAVQWGTFLFSPCPVFWT
jgi:hypothetical protein